MVGREEEVELLLRRWAKAKSGRGPGRVALGRGWHRQVATDGGAAGAAGGRAAHAAALFLLAAAHRQRALSDHRPHGARRRLARSDDAKTKLDKLDALLARAATSREDAALFAEMLSLPNDGRYPALELAPPQRRQKTMEALIGQIEAISRETPVLMIFEDAHWADPSSLEVFGRLADRIDALRVLLFVTFRPEFAAPWIGRPNVAALTINRLTQHEVETLIDRVVGQTTTRRHSQGHR